MKKHSILKQKKLVGLILSLYTYINTTCADRQTVCVWGGGGSLPLDNSNFINLLSKFFLKILDLCIYSLSLSKQQEIGNSTINWTTLHKTFKIIFFYHYQYFMSIHCIFTDFVSFQFCIFTVVLSRHLKVYDHLKEPCF